jgi:hypothetical protein
MNDHAIMGVPAPVLIVLIWFGLVAMLWLGFFVRAIYRTCIGPCWNCGSDRVRRSEVHGVFDLLARLSLLFPYRCTCCRKRFYKVSLFRPDEMPLEEEADGNKMVWKRSYR